MQVRPKPKCKIRLSALGLYAEASGVIAVIALTILAVLWMMLHALHVP
jgi:hypothetical protein